MPPKIPPFLDPFFPSQIPLILSGFLKFLPQPEGLQGPLSISLFDLLLVKKKLLFLLYFQEKFFALQLQLMLQIRELLLFNLLLIFESAFGLYLNSLKYFPIGFLLDTFVGLLDQVKGFLGSWIICLVRMEQFHEEIPFLFYQLVRRVEF